MPNFYNPNQGMINQLLRQKDNIDNLLNQYSQPQAPVQNIINTNGVEFEARILDGDIAENVLVNRRTMFLDKKNKKVLVKEVDGSISEQYEIIIPLDEKDKKILNLETKLKEMEEKFNEYSELNRANNGEYQSNANGNGDAKSTTKTDGKPVQRPIK